MQSVYILESHDLAHLLLGAAALQVGLVGVEQVRDLGGDLLALQEQL